MIGTNITIFGGTGDLAFRKLLPALYTMDCTGKLPLDSRIVSVGRRDYSQEAYRAQAGEWVRRFSRLPFSEKGFAAFARRLHYFRMDLTNAADYRRLDAFFAENSIGAHLFYYAVAPRFFAAVTQGLKTVSGAGGGKVMLEKPFGETLETARVLNSQLGDFFGAERIYRIDHYLGKEMVRNIQTIRFANPIFTDVWNARYIDSVQISALEDVGVETRGGYYDASGALRDMVQNHLFQILSIVAMEQPAVFDSAHLHQEQLRVLRALGPAKAETVADMLVLGQYEGYREEPLVAGDSATETFAALQLEVDNARWRGVPFYIRTGKKTGVRQTEVSIVFRRRLPGVEPDVLIIKIQPAEGVYLQFNIKRPGDTEEIIPAKMDFCQNCSLVHQANTPEAYERLLTACLHGERAWFSHWDQIELSWRYIEHLKELFAAREAPLHTYAPGTRGPRAAELLVEKAGRRWME